MVDKGFELDSSPHEGQSLVHDSKARFKVLVAGRRWGKTRLGVTECLDVASKGGVAWWVAPTYGDTAYGWRPLTEIARSAGLEVRIVDRIIKFPGGGWIQVKSAEKPDGLRGEGLDLVVLDEAALIRESAWGPELRPALADKFGKALFISTPKGHNWFHRLYLRGKKGEPGWESWCFPTVSNPFISKEEIEGIRPLTAAWIFEQEYLAVFISDGTQVFRNLDNCLGAELKDYRQGTYDYFFGVDLGRTVDFSVISVLEQKPNGEVNQVYKERFNEIGYLFQLERLRALNDRFKPVNILIEENNIGDLFVEICEKARLPVERFRTTNQSKKELIEHLAIGFERNSLRLLDDDIQLEELRSFGVEQLPSGRIKYAASSGHDDTVMALALSWLAVESVNTIEVVSSDFLWNYRG